MSIQKSNLTNYDMVVAVSQGAINTAIAEYLSLANDQVAIYGAYENGSVTLVDDSSDATLFLTGTLSYTLDAQGKPGDVVELYNANSDQSVCYRVPLTDGEFRSTIPALSWDLKQTDSSTPWVITFTVDLGLEATSLTDLPQSTQNQVTAALGDQADAFTIQQLFTDLNDAQAAKFGGITGLTDISSDMLESLLKAYLVQQQRAGGVLFGVTATAPTTLEDAPTFAPTAVGFVVTPYTDEAGNHSSPELDTLDYLVMTGDDPLPAYPPKDFGWNWVEDASVSGAVAVRSDLFVTALLPQLDPLLQTISPVLTVGADINAGIDQQPTSLGPGSSQSFSPVNPPSNGTVATYSYSDHPQTATDTYNGIGVAESVSNTATYDSECSVSLSGSAIHLAGSITVSGNVTTTSSSDGNPAAIDTITMLATTFSWSVDLVLQADLTANGQLDYQLQNQNFDSAPTTAAAPDPSWWQKFLDGLSGEYQTYANNIDDLRSDVQTTLNSVSTQLTSLLASANHFVFPGGNTFAFADPAFSDSLDLTADLTYLMPS